MSLSVDAHPQMSSAEVEIKAYIDPPGRLTMLFPNGGRRWTYASSAEAEAAAIATAGAYATSVGHAILMRLGTTEHLIKARATRSSSAARTRCSPA